MQPRKAVSYSTKSAYNPPCIVRYNDSIGLLSPRDVNGSSARHRRQRAQDGIRCLHIDGAFPREGKRSSSYLCRILALEAQDAGAHDGAGQRGLSTAGAGNTATGA